MATEPDLRLLRAVAADPEVRRAHVRVLRLLSQVQTLPEDTPQWRAAAREMAEACRARATAFDAWNAARSPDRGSGRVQGRAEGS